LVSLLENISTLFKQILLFGLLILTANFLFAQKTIEKTLKKFNNQSIPYITVEELKASDTFLLLDTREKKEFDVSHIKDAIYVGYDNFKITNLTEKNKDKKIVVYCSIGVRSEDIGEKLQTAGYTNVYNLYGGIFKWLDGNNPVVDSTNTTTNKIHAFSKYWSKLVTKGEKVLN